MQGDWSRFAYPVQRSYGISVDEWSDQPLVPPLMELFCPRCDSTFPPFDSMVLARCLPLNRFSLRRFPLLVSRR